MGTENMDKTAIAKMFWIFLVSLVFLIVYASEIKICDPDTNENNVTQSSCRMSLYGGTGDESYVKTWWYLVIWVAIMGWSFIGFALMCCQCNMLVRRFFCFGLFGLMGLLVVAEVMSIIKSAEYWKEYVDAGKENEYSASSHLAQAVAITLMEMYLLGTAVADAWTED